MNLCKLYMIVCSEMEKINIDRLPCKYIPFHITKEFKTEYNKYCKRQLSGEYWELMEKDVRMTYTKKKCPITIYVQQTQHVGYTA